MSRKRETGRPVDWTTPDRIGRYYREANAEAIADNEKIECLAPACDGLRSDRSRYCARHARRLRDAGDPVCRLPKAQELQVHENRLRRDIEQLPEPAKSRVRAIMDDVVRTRLRKPEGWAAGYYGIHGRMPIKAKAAVVLANLAKHRFDQSELVYRALALEAWARTRYNGMPQNRERFIQTQIGKLAIRKAGLAFTQRIRTSRVDTSVMHFTPQGPKPGKIAIEIEKKAYKNLSGTVAREVGASVLEASSPIWRILVGEHERR